MLSLIKKVSEGIFKPKVNKDIEKALETDEGKHYAQFLMHGLLAQNYILNMKFRGKITDRQFEDLIRLAGTKEGLLQISGHMILSGVDAEAEFHGVNVVNPEPVEEGKICDPSIEKYIIEPADPTKVESTCNPMVAKKIN